MLTTWYVVCGNQAATPQTDNRDVPTTTTLSDSDIRFITPTQALTLIKAAIGTCVPSQKLQSQ